ncbi:MAG: hypothetical protein NVS9B4_03620 [Candidatus Acidiferrum sp.]
MVDSKTRERTSEADDTGALDYNEFNSTNPRFVVEDGKASATPPCEFAARRPATAQAGGS